MGEQFLTAIIITFNLVMIGMIFYMRRYRRIIRIASEIRIVLLPRLEDLDMLRGHPETYEWREREWKQRSPGADDVKHLARRLWRRVNTETVLGSATFLDPAPITPPPNRSYSYEKEIGL